MIWPFKKPKTWKEHFDRGMSLGGSGNLERAAQHFKKATELAPNEPYPHYELGYTLFLQGKYVEALDELNWINELAPGFFLVQTEIFLCKAIIAGEINAGTLSKLRALQQMTDTGKAQSPEAAAMSLAVISEAPTCALGHFFLGKALFEQDRNRSEAALRRCMELSPDDTTAINALMHIGMHRNAADDVQAAQTIWTDLLARYKGNPHARLTEMIRKQANS